MSAQFSSEPEPSSISKDGKARPLPTPQINLLRGWPSTALLPTQLLKAGAETVLSSVYKPPSQQQDVRVTRPIDYGSLALAEQAMLYGPDPGHYPLRVQLSKWLASFYGPATLKRYQGSSKGRLSADGGYEISPLRITLTGGASQSVGVILAALTDPTYTRNIWLVAPAYFLSFRIFEDAGFGLGRMRAVPELRTREEESRGPDVAWLRREIEKVERESGEQMKEPKLKPPSRYPKIYRHVIYTVPSFSNPSSITTSASVREELVRCARDFDALVLCDDVYDALQWHAHPDTHANSMAQRSVVGNHVASSEEKSLDVAPLPRVVDVERALHGELDNSSEFGNVVSNSTFSKICGPGCRVGWVEASPKLAYQISQAGTSKSGGSPGHAVSTFLSSLIETGELQNHISEVLRPSYAERYHRVTSAIRQYLEPLGVSLPAPHDLRQCSPSERAGGYFIWLALPPGCSAAKVVKRALEEQNLVVAGGKIFEVPGDDHEGVKFGSNLRLCFSWEEMENLTEGVKRLGKAVEAVLQEGSDEKPVDEAAEEREMRRLQDLDKDLAPFA